MKSTLAEARGALAEARARVAAAEARAAESAAEAEAVRGALRRHDAEAAAREALIFDLQQSLEHLRAAATNAAALAGEAAPRWLALATGSITAAAAPR